MGIRLGVRRRLGRRNIPIRWRSPPALRQGERGDLLQRTKNCARDGLESLVAANPARCCSLIVSVARRTGLKSPVL